MADPTADDFFGGAPSGGAAPTAVAAGALPTADQFFNPGPPQSGAAHDTIWSSLASAGARILNSAGYGAQQGWGADTPDLDQGSIAALRKAGVFNDYSTGHEVFLKSANEALLRGAASAAELVAHAPGTVVGGLTGAAQQIGEEIKGKGASPVRSALAYPFAAGGEAGEDLQGGALGELPAFSEVGLTERTAQAAQSERVMQAAKARSTAVIGEGEAGYYGAQPVTPENLQARTEAAGEAGIEPPAPEPAAVDIHEVARRIDPETFQQYDALAAERETQRQALSDMVAEREKTPEALQAKAEIDEIAGGGSETERAARLDAVRASAPEAVIAKLDDAQGRLDAALSTDTPEMVEARNKLMDADFAMRELAPTVSQAYRQAADMMPEQIPPKATGAAPEAEAEKGEAQTPKAAEPAKPESAAPAEPGQPGAEGQPPVLPVEAEQAIAENAPAPNTETAKPAPANPKGGIGKIEGTGELETRSLSEGVEANAIADGITESFGDLPEYRTLSMADQAAKAADLITKDYEGAKAVAMGEKQPPKGLLPESVFVGVEKRALAEGDVETLRQLATRSKLSTAATTMGQRIRTLGERDQASPVGAILDVQAAREKDLAKRMDIEAAKAETVNEIRDEVRKSASKPQAWADFIESIKCGE